MLDVEENPAVSWRNNLSEKVIGGQEQAQVSDGSLGADPSPQVARAVSGRGQLDFMGQAHLPGIKDKSRGEAE